MTVLYSTAAPDCERPLPVIPAQRSARELYHHATRSFDFARDDIAFIPPRTSPLARLQKIPNELSDSGLWKFRPCKKLSKSQNELDKTGPTFFKNAANELLDVFEIPQNPVNEPMAASTVGWGMRAIVIIIALAVVVVGGVLIAGAALNHNPPAIAGDSAPPPSTSEKKIFNMEPSGDQPGKIVEDNTSPQQEETQELSDQQKMMEQRQELQEQVQSTPYELEQQRLEEERQLVEAQQKLEEQKQQNKPQPVDDPSLSVKPFTDFR